MPRGATRETVLAKDFAGNRSIQLPEAQEGFKHIWKGFAIYPR